MQLRKFALLLVPLVGLLLLGSCKKALGILDFDVNDTGTVQLPATGPLPGAVLVLPGATLSSTSTATFAANNTTADYVQDARLKRLVLTVTDPTAQNFDFLKSINIYISKDATGTSKNLLASLDAVPTGQTTLELKPSDNPVDGYLRNSSYALFVEAELAQPLRQNTTLRVDSRFSVRVQLPPR